MARMKRDNPFGRRVSGVRPAWIRASGLGLEFAGAVAGFAMIGYFVDRRCDSEPWGVLIGAILGLAGGMYNLIRASLAAMRDATPKAGKRPKAGGPKKDPGGNDAGG